MALTQLSLVSTATPTRRRRTVRKATLHKLTIPQQVALAFQPQARLAALAGLMVSGFVPVAVYMLVHYEVAAAAWKWYMVGGGLLYSAASVYKWATKAFQGSGRCLTAAKSLGFVALLESVTSFSSTHWLALCGLCILTLINAVSAAVSIQAIE